MKVFTLIDKINSGAVIGRVQELEGRTLFNAVVQDYIVEGMIKGKVYSIRVYKQRGFYYEDILPVYRGIPIIAKKKSPQAVRLEGKG